MDMFSEMTVGAPWGSNVAGGSHGAEVPEGLSELTGSAWADTESLWARAKRDAEVRDRQKQERLKAAEVLHHVWLYDEEADSRAAVDASDKYSYYASGSARLDEGMLPIYGRDYAEAVMPNVADDPWACIEAQLEAVEDEGRKAEYKREFEELKLKGGDTANDYYGLFGRMVRDGVRGRYAAFKAKEAAVQVSLGKMNRYVAGEDVMDAGAEGAEDGFTAADLDNVRSVADPKLVGDAEAVRAFMRTYVKPLGKKDDAEEILRSLSGLEDELFECIGEDVQRAELVREALMDFAEGMKKSNKVGVDDEFVVAVGKKLQDWGRVLDMYEKEHAVAAAYMHQDFISDAYIEAMEEAQEATRRKYEQYKKYENSRAVLRAAINKSLEVDKSEHWAKGSLRAAFMMAGDTLPYLVPVVGTALGTADVAVRGLTEGTDMYRLKDLTGEQAGGQAAVDTIVQAGVELFPFSRVGGKGLSAFVRSRFGAGLAKGKVGALSRWAVRQTQKSLPRAMAAEWGAAMIDEAVLEPVAGGFLQYGVERVFDFLEFEHGQTKELAACFEELKQVWEPRQLAGLAMFTLGLTGVSTPAINKNVKYFAAKRVMWEAQGLKPGQVDELMAIKDVGERVEAGTKMVNDGWANDAAGMSARMAKQNAEIKGRGEVLVLTGEGAVDPEIENSELAPAYRAVWNEYVEKGLLPKVEAQKDGQFKLTQKDGKEYVMSAAHADAYLEHAIAEAEGVMLAEARTAAEKAEGVNLREEIGLAVSRIAGGAALRTVAKNDNSGIAVKDLVAGLPDFLAAPILAKGHANLADAKAISEWALGQIRALVDGGASEFDARMTRPEADGMARSLGEWSTFAEDFATRERLERLKPGEGASSVSRYRAQKAVQFNGRKVMGQVIVGIKGRVSHYGAVEDITESVTDMMLQERAAVLVEQGEAGSLAEGARMALEELADVVRRAREVVMKADPDAEIEEIEEGENFYMSVIEALSTMARAKFLSSGVVPKWMESLTSGLKGIVGTGMAVEKVRAAYAEVLRKDPNALAELEGMLADMGVYVQDAIREARIEAVDIQAWKSASAIVGARAAGPMGVGGAAVSDAVQEAERTEQEIVEAESKQDVLPVKSAAEVAAEEKERLGEMVPGSNAPAEMQGVFVDDKCYYNEAGGFWCGMIAKEKLSDGTEQVKVGAKGKHGVIQGKELTGNFQQNVGAIYVWKRKDGSLQVISGRHRFAKLMEDAGAKYCNCYVFEEDAEHDEKWARMLDYENNMRDDQADEVTAATYVRETGLPDEVLKERGLLRNHSRSKRGIFIGRHARQELWTRFVNGAVKPKDAEIICELTRSVKAEERIDEIQGKCCMLLDTGKSWEYIGGMVQLMASKEAQMKQGLLDFGADFMEDLTRAAEWIEKCVHKVDAAIKMLRNGRKMSGEMREEALRLGVQTETDADSEEVLRDLQLLRKKFELIGSYPDLVAQAQMWDGKSDVDPVGYYLENARKERIEAQLEGEMTAEEYLAEQARKAAAEAVPNLFTMEMVPADAMALFAKRQADLAEHGVVAERYADYKGIKVDVATTAHWGQEFSLDALRRYVWEAQTDREDSYLTAWNRWKDEALPVLENRYKKKYRDIYAHINSGRATMPVIKEAVKMGIIPAPPRKEDFARVLDLEDAAGRELLLQRGAYFERRKQEIVPLIEQVYGPVTKVDISRKSVSTYYYTDFGKVRLSDHFLDYGPVPAADLRFDMDDAQVLAELQKQKEKIEQRNAEMGRAYATGEVSFSIFNERRWANDVWPTRAMKKIEADWLERLDAYIAEYQAAKANPNMKRPMGQEIYVCPTPGVLSLVGVTSRDVVTTRHALDHDMFTKHGMTRKALRHLPSAIANPICIAESQSVPGALEILTTLTETVEDSKTKALVKKNVLVALHVGVTSSTDRKLIVSKIASAYGKNHIRTIINKHKILYWNDQKGKVMLNDYRLQLPQAVAHDLSTGNIWDFNDLVKYKQQNKFSFSMERNLAAVHSLSAEKFLGALELGGMPLPSVAVTRLDKPYSWGGAGNIMLVGRPAMVDPKEGTEVYSRDAWTGNIPHLLHKPVGKDDRSKACLDLQAISDKYRLRSDYNDYFRLEGHISLRGSHENVDKSDMEYHLRRPAGQALFAWQSGYRPRPKMKDAVRVHDWLTKEFAEKLREYTKLTPDEYHEKEREVMELARKEAEAFYGERTVIKNAPNAEAAQKRLGAWVNTAMRVFDVYSPSALARELDDVKLIGKRVLDTEGNLKMLAAYADKHKRAYEAWVQAKLDAWFSKERYIEGTNTLATLEALTRHMLGEKSRGKEKGLAFSSGLVRAHHAERMETLADIQRRRELLTDSEASNELKSETNELMEYWREGAAAILSRGMNGFGFEVRDDLMETLAKVKGVPTAEKLRAALRKMFRGATHLPELLNDAKVIGYGVEALKSLHAELEDYMEAVPQRAVKMDEWEYAVMPESLKKNKAVMAGLREHGIRPRFHDGTEEGRKAVLAGLVNDSRVSFSVIGPKAETWEWYQDVAFKGRDDGMLRAEIDASGARLKTLTGAAAYDYRREVENVQDFWRKRYARWMELDALFDTVYYSDEEPTEEQRAEAAAAAEEYYMLTEEVKDMMEALIERGGAWPSYTQLEAADKQALRMGMVRSLAAGKVDEAVYEKLGALSAGEKIYSLEDVLDFPELYEAYPKLKLVPVQFELLGRYNGLVTNYAYGAEYSVIKLNKPLLENADAFRSTLLHEVQHVIQRIEGYAKGGNVEGVYKHMKEELEYNDAEMKRLAKELRWFSALDYAKDYLKSARRLLRFPNAWKYNGLRYRHWKAALGNEDMTRLLVDDIAEQYEELRQADEFETKRRGNWIKPVEYALPMVDFSDLAGVERGLAALEGLKSRRSAFRGVAPKKDKEYIKLMKYTNAAKRMLDKYAMEPYELYRRLAGEIEARNVQTRRDWTMDERLARPFNETLEYPGEALVTFSMERASLQALEVLRTRADEREGERLMNDWQKACEGWAQLHVGGDDSRLGNGAKMLGEIYALIGATKGVLPEKYARMGHLNGLLRWAAVYANMQQTGDVPAAGVIAGPIYEKFVERMRYIDKKNEAYGLNEAEVKEAMALLAGERLDVAMLKVARECKQRLEMFLKDRERERIDWVVERAYPKREKGKRSPRGKMDADTYRRMERAYRLMEMEANDVAGLMNRIKAALENMETAPADAVEVLRSLRGGDVPGVDEVEALEAELEDELFLAQTFGCWENMAFEQARRASGAMAELVLLGRSAWQSKLRAERRRAAFDRDEVSRHFGTKLEDVQAVRGDKTAKEKGRKRTSAKNLVMGSMSYSQLLVALEEKLGKRFTGRHMRMIAEAHEKIMLENQRRHRWMYNTLRDITGLETEGEIEEWMQKNNEVFDTGIDLELPMKSTCRLTPEEAKMWLSLTAAERQKKREELVAEAAKKGEKPDNIPGEDVMAELEEKLVNAELNAAMPKEFVLTTEWSYKSRLRCTREALLYAILTFEQDDYEHLLEANGLTQAKLQQMRKLVGKELLRWGYAMRKELSEHGKMVAELYEAYTGVPFGQRQNYFRGVFDVARSKDAGEAVDQVSGVTGGKYGILIARQYHNQQLNWSTSASLVFVSTMKEQQNYIATAHITREWRTLLSDRLFERRVRAEIGDAALDMLTGWMKMIEGAVLADAKVNTIMNNMVGKLAKAYAVSRLAGNAYTIMKQASALLNGFVGGYVPERVLAGNELVQELTYRHVGFGEYMAALGKAMAGKTEITMKELESAGFIEGRKNVQGSHIEEAALLSPWQTVPGKVGRKGRALYEANMDAIGFVDRKANAKAALAIAEVVYQQAKKENADGLVPDAELRRVALETARMMVDRAAQPQLRTQKGYLAAGGGMFGALGNFFYMFKSETLNKIGLYVAQMMAGQHRAWLVGALSFGVMNSVVLALIDWICGRWYDDDDEKWEKRAKSFAGNVFFNDIATVPFAGDIVDWVRGQWLGERYWASNSLVSWGTDTWKYGARVWENIDEGASWDKHVTALCSLARSVGALGGVGLNGHSAAVGSCCELTLAAASLSNTVRFFKDVVKKVVGE